MSEFTKVTMLSLLVLSTGVFNGCGPKVPSKVVAVGSRSTGPTLSVSGGNYLAHSEKPGVLFGTAIWPGRDEVFTYAVIFRHDIYASDLPNVSASGTTADDVEGEGCTTDDSITVNGKALRAKYHLTWDAVNQLPTELLEVNGRQVEIAAGRVFLVDLTAEQQVVDQLDVELSTEIGQLATSADVERIADALLVELKDQIPESYAN